MSSVAVALRSRVERARVAVSADVLAVSALALISVVLVALTWGTWGDLDSDTGYDLVAGARIADGELPYRDFIYYYGPVGPALAGLISFAAGAGITPIVILGFAITFGILAATYLVARIVVGRLGALLAGALTAAVAFIPDNYSYVLPHTTDATLGTLLLLVLLLCVWQAASNGARTWLAAVGGCVGLLLLTKPEPALAGVVAVSLWLVVRGRRCGSFRRDALLVGAPAVLIPLVAYSLVLTWVSPHRLLFDNLYPTDVLEAGGDTELHGRMPLTAGSFLNLGGKLALYAIGAGLLLLVAHGLRRPPARRPLLAAAAVALVGAVGAAILDSEALRHGLEFAYGWVPAGAVVALVVLLARALRDREEWVPLSQLQLAGIAALASVAATIYPGFFPHAPHEQMAAYYIPLAAVFLARLHLRELAPVRSAHALGAAWLAFLALAGFGLTVKDARADSVRVRGAGGSLAETPRDAALYVGALEWIERTTEPGEPIFVGPLMTGLYALSGHRSPLEELSLLPDALPSRDDERRAIAALERSRVRLVLTDDRPWPGYGHTSFGKSFDRLLADWISTHFDRVATLRAPAWTSFEGFQAERSLTVWIRRDA